MDVLGSGHEQVVFCSDEESGLRAIIALHSTALGPGLGGTRFYPYASEEAALADVLALSKGMTYKNSLAGRTVAVAGAGKVGSHLIGHLVEDGADVLVTDVDPAAVERVRSRHPQVTAVEDTATLVRTPHDVYSPNALGGALDPETVAALPSRIVCGGANNQLGTPEVAEQLRGRGILYAPDYLVNAGGVIQVEDERHGFSFPRAEAKAAGIFDTALRVFEAAAAEGVSPAVAADRLAEERMREVGRLATIRL